MKTGHMRDVDAAFELEKMSRYTTDGAVNSSSGKRLRHQVELFIQANPFDRWRNGWLNNEGDFLTTLCWDQDQDFGLGLSVRGAMGSDGASGHPDYTRGVLNAARLRLAGVNLSDAVQGKSCCLIGAWCGYEMLLLSALGASSVHTVEEVPEYSRMCGIQREAFGVPGVDVAKSIYQMSAGEIASVRSDIVYCPGVLYHCSDVATAVLLTRLLGHPGGHVFIETITRPDPEGGAKYLGPSRPGWNWWKPSRDTWIQLMADCGITDAYQVDELDERAWFAGSIDDHRESAPIKKSAAAGFSRPDLLELLP